MLKHVQLEIVSQRHTQLVSLQPSYVIATQFSRREAYEAVMTCSAYNKSVMMCNVQVKYTFCEKHCISLFNVVLWIIDYYGVDFAAT